jgi:hypothetical protein
MHENLRFRPRETAAAFLSIGVVPVLLFVLILLLPIPPTISRRLTAYSWPLFVAVGLLYFGAYRSRYAVAVASGLTLALLGMSLSFLWHSGYSDDKILGGLLPLRDALDYFNGAEWILGGQAIKVINEGAAWRPLYPGFLSSLLWMTGRNLQASLALQVCLAGICFALVGASLYERLGAAPAALFSSLLFFFIQPLVGTAYTETLGLAVGCLAFALLWRSADAPRMWELLTALGMLLLAVSIRAGAFFVLPLLIIWAAFPYLRFSPRRFLAALAVVVTGFAAFNRVYNSLLVEPGAQGFGNFAFTLYGQVSGGAGYHKAFEDLGVRDPAVIMRAAERFFLAHPIGFAVGSAKAYRDFFSPVWGVMGLGLGPVDVALSLACLLLLASGLYAAVRQLDKPRMALLGAAFLGILLSVPFLPPIDGGIRIYASTMPFVFVLPAIGLALLLPSRTERPRQQAAAALSLGIGLVIAGLTVVVPPLIRWLSVPVPVAALSCPADQVAFVAGLSPGTYISLNSQEDRACGSLPEVCLSDFARYAASNDEGDAALFATIADLAGGFSGSESIVFVGNDLVRGKPHVYVGSAPSLAPTSEAVILGCATETLIKGRPSVYSLQSFENWPGR